MMSETAFTVLLAVIWLSEVAFGAVVVYWFVTQGLDDETATVSGVQPLEDRSFTARSMAMWAGFFAVLVIGILLAS